MDAMVTPLDHLHALWTLLLRDRDYSARRMLTKTGFS
jgi:hypothetical protein